MTNKEYWAILLMAKQSLEIDFLAKQPYERLNCMSITEMNKLYAVIEAELKTLACVTA